MPSERADEPWAPGPSRRFWSNDAGPFVPWDGEQRPFALFRPRRAAAKVVKCRKTSASRVPSANERTTRRPRTRRPTRRSWSCRSTVASAASTRCIKRERSEPGVRCQVLGKDKARPGVQTPALTPNTSHLTPASEVKHRGVALIGRAAVSKTVGWGFESLHPCQRLGDGR